MSSGRVTLKGQVIAEIVAGNPGGRLKAVEYGQFGEIVRVEWLRRGSRRQAMRCRVLAERQLLRSVRAWLT